ncbi:MAG: pyridoxal-phosphate-dependent aminotransferase family protein [Candidatus Limnocylindrales bacterium]
MSDTVQLRIPGPTPLPETVREAGSRQMVNHRGPEFKELLGRVTAAMKKGFRTEAEVLILTSSGTGALEAAVVNTLSVGDSVLSVNIGVFGDRFAKIARAYGADVATMAVEHGKAAEPAEVGARLREMAAAPKPAKAVLVTFNETSTGVTNPLEEIAREIHQNAPDALILVDAVSGLGAIPLEMDAWGLDVVTTGSQKSWMVPPGLAMVALSARAWAAVERSNMPRFYFDLTLHRDALTKGETPWTPAISVAFALDEGLRLIQAEGYPAIFARHAACADAARAGLQALGIRLLADPEVASNTVTSAWLPDGVEWSALTKACRARGLVLAGGQGPLTGRIFRVGHLGSVSTDDMVRCMEILEDALTELGIEVEPGAGSKAAADAARNASVGATEREPVFATTA